MSDEERSDERDRAHKHHVVGRDSRSRMDRPKKLLWNRIAAAHTVKQSRGAELRSMPEPTVAIKRSS